MASAAAAATTQQASSSSSSSSSVANHQQQQQQPSTTTTTRTTASSSKQAIAAASHMQHCLAEVIKALQAIQSVDSSNNGGLFFLLGNGNSSSGVSFSSPVLLQSMLLQVLLTFLAPSTAFVSSCSRACCCRYGTRLIFEPFNDIIFCSTKIKRRPIRRPWAPPSTALLLGMRRTWLPSRTCVLPSASMPAASSRRT